MAGKNCWRFIQLFFARERFVRVAKEHDFPPGPARSSGINDPLELTRFRASELAKSIGKSLFLVSAVTVLAGVAAYFANAHLRITEAVVVGARIVGIAIFAWAVLGRVGWSIQSMSGKTMIEQMNGSWFRVLYIAGFGIGVFSLLLKPNI